MTTKNDKFSSGELFHKRRRRLAFKSNPEIRELYKPDITIGIFALFYPIFHFLLAYFSMKLSWYNVVLLAWFLGSYLVFSKFNHLHEMSHNLVFGKIKTIYMDLVMRWIALPDFTGAIYYYYRFHHLSHHKRMGKDTLKDALANRYNRGVDLDLVLFAGKVSTQKNSNHEMSYLPKPGLFRVFFAGILPLIFLVSRTVALPRNIYWCLLSFLGLDKSRSREMLVSQAIQNILWVTLVLGLTFFTSSWKPLMYLALSQLFYNGFLWHPYLAFWLGIHKTGENGEPTQSIYGAFMTFISQKMSLHVEHHDFPQIPIRKLPIVTQELPKFYESIPHTKEGYFQIIRQYYSANHWVYGGQNFSENSIVIE